MTFESQCKLLLSSLISPQAHTARIVRIPLLSFPPLKYPPFLHSRLQGAPTEVRNTCASWRLAPCATRSTPSNITSAPSQIPRVLTLLDRVNVYCQLLRIAQRHKFEVVSQYSSTKASCDVKCSDNIFGGFSNRCAESGSEQSWNIIRLSFSNAQVASYVYLSFGSELGRELNLRTGIFGIHAI